MESSVFVIVQEQDFTIQALSEKIQAKAGEAGALVAFVGMVRDFNEGSALNGLLLEHYPGMTEKSLHSIAQRALARWELLSIAIIHRVGRLENADNIVGVAVRSRHRKNAFEACEFIMDFLKTEAPFWKKELTPSGDIWVDAKATDDEAKERW